MNSRCKIGSVVVLDIKLLVNFVCVAWIAKVLAQISLISKLTVFRTLRKFFLITQEIVPLSALEAAQHQIQIFPSRNSKFLMGPSNFIS